MTMNIQEALEAAKTSPLLSKFEVDQLGTLVTTLKLLSYAASHPQTQGTEPPFEQIAAFMEVNPDLVEIYSKVAHCILQDISNLDYPKTPAHEVYAEAMFGPIGGLLAIAITGEKRPTLDQIQEVLDSNFAKALLDRALTILWTIFYPGQPLANGKVYDIQSFAEECKASFEA